MKLLDPISGIKVANNQEGDLRVHMGRMIIMNTDDENTGHQ